MIDWDFLGTLQYSDFLAYLIGDNGIIVHDVAVGTEAIQKLISNYPLLGVPAELEMTEH